MILKTKFKLGFLTLTVLFATIAGVLSCNNEPKTEDTKDVAEEHNEAKFDNTIKENDAQFLVNAAEINLEEIQLGLLAQQRSKTKIVMDLGKMIENSHSKSMSELTELSAKKIVTIPTTPTDKAKKAYEELIRKTGNKFDNDFCKAIVDGHMSAVSLFEKASLESTDVDIKAWAVASLPILQTHLDEAIICQKECEKMK